MATDLSGVFPTALDLLCIYCILALNLFVLQRRVNALTHVLNALLLVKDVAVIVAWAQEQYYSAWAFDGGLAQWGFLLLRRPAGLPVILALLNIFVLRLNYLRAVFNFVEFGAATAAEPPLTTDLVKFDDLIAEAASPGSYYSGLQNPFKSFSSLVSLYIFVMQALLVVNALTGSVVVFLALFALFAHFLFLALLSHVLVQSLQWHGARCFIAEKNLTLLRGTKYGLGAALYHTELREYRQARVEFGFELRKAKYLHLFWMVLPLIICASYGSVWLAGADFGAILRFAYASPYQLTFNVLSYETGNWNYVMRWLAPL
jgi:hypothetical protein